MNDPATLRILELVQAAGLREPCDLDLFLFFSRYPRVVLSSEQLATYVGHDVQHVARALELLLSARLLRRVLNQGGRMYVLDVERVGAWLEPLQRLCATPDGRHALRMSLKQRLVQEPAMDGKR